MTKKPPFSIIIPTYNRAEFILKAIASVLDQKAMDFELIVIDDGSTDNTIEQLSTIKDPRFRFISIPNRERAAARNRGAQIAVGDYLNFLDSDDILLFNHLQTAAKAVKDLNQPEIFHLNFEVRNTSNKLLKTGKKYGKHGLANKELIVGNPFSCNGVFIRRDIALEFPFNEDRNLSGYGEDYELWIRLGSRFPLHAIDTVTSIIVTHEGRSVLNAELDNLENRKDLLLKYAFEDQEVKNQFGKKQKAIRAYCNTYIALHLVLGGRICDGLKYFSKGVLMYPGCVYDRRTLGIIKNSFIRMLNKYSN